MTGDDNDTQEKWVATFRHEWEEHLADFENNRAPTVGDTIVRAIEELGAAFAEELKAELIPINDSFQVAIGQQHQIVDGFEEVCRIADEQQAPLPDPASACSQHPIVYPGTMIELLLVYWQHKAARSPGSNEAVWMTFPPEWPAETVHCAGERWRSERKLTEGVTFAGCQILEYVSSGGFGDVYKVAQPPFVVPRALKILRGDKLWALSQTQQDRRGQSLFSEAVKLDQLSQNAIFPKVHEADVHDGKHYVIMEFLDGQTLWERQTSGSPLTPAETCRLGSKVAEGLDFAVQLGVIHGDISPKNILVMNGNGSEPKIIDFSAIGERPTDPTVATSIPETRMMSQFAGTMGYIAPEVLARTHDHGEPSEVFGLAATLYYAITSTTPKRTTTSDGRVIIELVEWIDADRFVSESARASAFRIFSSALSAEPSDRPTLRDFARQLERIANDFRQTPVVLKPMNHVETEVVPQTGHGDSVTACAISADGAFVLTGSSDCSAILWDVQTGANLRTFVGHEKGVNFVALSADGMLALTGSSDEKTFHLWNTRTGQAMCTYSSLSRLAALSADGSAVIGERHSHFELLDLRGGNRRSLRFGEETLAIALSADGSVVMLVERSHGTTWVKSFDSRTMKGRSLFSLPYFYGRPDVIVFSSDGKTVLELDKREGKTVCRVWNMETGSIHRSFDVDTRVKHVVLSADGALALMGTVNSTLLWDLRNGTKLSTVGPHVFVQSVALSADGKLACTGAEDGTCNIWDTQTGNQVRILKGHDQTLRDCGPSNVAASLNNDGRMVLTAKWGSLIFDKQTYRKYDFQLANDRRVCVAASSDATCVLAGQGDSHIILDTRTGQSRTLSRKLGGTTDVALSSDGTTAFAGSIDKPCGILWDTHTFGHHSSFEWKGTKLPKGSGVIRNGRLTIPITGSSAGLVVLSADGTVCFTGIGDHASTLWDVKTGKELRTFQHGHDHITAVGISSNGALAVTGFHHGIATLWNSHSGEEIRKFKNHRSTIRLIVVSSDGNLVLMGSDDRTAILWDLHTGVEQVTFKGHASPITALALSNDCKRVLTCGSDGTTRIWDTKTGDELCTLFVFDAGNHWLVVDPMGRFDCSKGGEHLVAFRTKGSHNLVPPGRAKADHFTPGLLQSILAR